MTRHHHHRLESRMGQALIRCAAAVTELQIVGTIDQGDDLRSVIKDAMRSLTSVFIVPLRASPGCAHSIKKRSSSHDRAQ